MYVSRAFEQICERTVASIYANPMSYREVIHPEDVPRVLAQLALLEKTDELHDQFRIVCPQGTVKWVEVRGFTAKDSLGNVTALVGTAQDITERRRAEERIRSLSGHLLQLQDEERRKIARDLHDVTGQDLVALSTTLGSLHAATPASSRKSRKVISQCQAVTDRCIREIRTLSYLLHPPMLDEAGLEDAIRHYVSGFSERTGIEVILKLAPNFGRLAHEEEMAFFRVMQESLVNIHRHSGSFTASVSLDRTPREIRLEMNDQGRGIPGGAKGRSNGVSSAGGVGIQSMRERMKQVGGQLEIDSGPNGTTVRATVPGRSHVHE